MHQVAAAFSGQPRVGSFPQEPKLRQISGRSNAAASLPQLKSENLEALLVNVGIALNHHVLPGERLQFRGEDSLP